MAACIKFIKIESVGASLDWGKIKFSCHIARYQNEYTWISHNWGKCKCKKLRLFPQRCGSALIASHIFWCLPNGILKGEPLFCQRLTSRCHGDARVLQPSQPNSHPRQAKFSRATHSYLGHHCERSWLLLSNNHRALCFSAGNLKRLARLKFRPFLSACACES